MTKGKIAILAERKRQIDIEGWSSDHDDEHGADVLEGAAVSYRDAEGPETLIPDTWPWEAQWWKPKCRQRNLERAGALYIAASQVADRRHDYSKRDELNAQANSCALLLDSII